MGLFDFLSGKKEKHNKWIKPKEHVHKVEEAPKKKDLGVCVPHHAKSAEEKKKLKGKKEVSPFEKLRLQHLKETDQFNKEFEEISEQEPEEPYDYSPELGVESIETKKEEEVEEKKFIPRKLDMMKPGQKGEYDQNDELDVAAEKMSKGYVPKFSSTARKKLGYDDTKEEAEERAEEMHKSTGSGSFEVTGVYLGAESMISGRVISGKVGKKMTAQFGNVSVRITDLKKSFASVSELGAGDSGTIFTRANASLIKSGDILDFS
jgi:hypothetical protein